MSEESSVIEHVGSHKTCLECKMHGYLTELGLVNGEDYYEQYSFGDYILDFAFIKSRNPLRGVDIETDGDPWHTTPSQRSRDGYRTYRLMKSGWLVERFGETFTLDEVESVLIKHNLLSHPHK